MKIRSKSFQSTPASRALAANLPAALVGKTGFVAKVSRPAESLRILWPGTRDEHIFLRDGCGIEAGETVFVETENGFAVRAYSLDDPACVFHYILVRDEDKKGKLIFSSARHVPSELIAVGHKKVEHAPSRLVRAESKAGQRVYERLNIAGRLCFDERAHDQAEAKKWLYTVRYVNGRIKGITREDQLDRFVDRVIHDHLL